MQGDFQEYEKQVVQISLVTNIQICRSYNSCQIYASWESQWLTLKPKLQLEVRKYDWVLDIMPGFAFRALPGSFPRLGTSTLFWESGVPENACGVCGIRVFCCKSKQSGQVSQFYYVFCGYFVMGRCLRSYSSILAPFRLLQSARPSGNKTAPGQQLKYSGEAKTGLAGVINHRKRQHLFQLRPALEKLPDQPALWFTASLSSPSNPEKLFEVFNMIWSRKLKNGNTSFTRKAPL